MSTVDKSETYAFAAVEVDANARELRRDGQLLTLQPKAFDLLLYLLRHRHRVVTKTELLDNVWGRAEVGDGVVARAVMRLREALGDRSERGALLRTVHRVGYRFCAEVREPSARATERIVPLLLDDCSANTNVESLRIVLLPMDCYIRSTDYDWVALGLSSMIGRLLETDPRFSVVPVATMLQALATLSNESTAAEQTALLLHCVGAQCVVRASVYGDPFSFWIEYSGEGPRGVGLDGRLSGSDLIDLGEWLAREIERHAFPNSEAKLTFESTNTLVNQTFALALQARNEQRSQAALKLIDVVLEMEPDNTDAMLFRLQVMMNMLHPDVLLFGTSLLEHPKFVSSPRLLAQTHASLGLASMQLTDAGTSARQHADEAFRLTGSDRMDASSLRIYGICGVIASTCGNRARARALAEYCIDKQRLCGDRFSLSLNLINLASVDIEELNFESARKRLEEGLAFVRPNGFTHTAMGALINLAAGVHAPEGEWALAIRRCHEASDLMRSFTHQRNSILWIASMSIVYAEMSMVAQIDASLAALETVDDAESKPLHAAWLTASAHRSIAVRDFESARRPLAEALLIHRATRAVTYMRRGGSLLLRNEMRAGHIDAAIACAESLLSDETCMGLGGEIEGLRLHALAASAHASGNDAVAAQRLAQAISIFPAGLYRALAILDAAWLTMEAKRLDDAQEMLTQIPNWTREHALGQYVSACLRRAARAAESNKSGRLGRLLSLSEPAPKFQAVSR